MAGAKLMLGPDDVRERARTCYGRSWKQWAADMAVQLLVSGGGAAAPVFAGLSVNLHAPRERDLDSAELRTRAMAWVRAWRDCSLPVSVDWQNRRWARVGNQLLPVRAVIPQPYDVAVWAGEHGAWDAACARVRDAANAVGAALPGITCDDERAEAIRAAVRTSVAVWCEMDDADWLRALDVLAWLLAHPDEQRYVRQLPIRGIDTKWMERHGAALRPLYRALTGRDFAFARPAHQFRCKACSPSVSLSGCREFSLDARELDGLSHPGSGYPLGRIRAVLICENLVNTLCLDGFEGVLAVHGGGFAVGDLRDVGWLRGIPVWYWGDLDSNGFAILNMLREFLPHARSLMMDARTLERYRDLCVDEPKPAAGVFARLTADEAAALNLLRQGDPMREIGDLRLEQERIEWEWAMRQMPFA